MIKYMQYLYGLFFKRLPRIEEINMETLENDLISIYGKGNVSLFLKEYYTSEDIEKLRKEVYSYQFS